MVIFRENTEDVYAGIEWQAGSPEANKLREFLKTRVRQGHRANSAIGIKPMSEFGSKRLIDKAIRYALEEPRVVTLVHKGNIMKFTEGAFKDWGYELAREKFARRTCRPKRTSSKAGAGARAERSSSRTASPTRCSSRCCCAPTSTP